MTPHFKGDEVSCRCGCGMYPKQDFMDKVERVRVRCGFPMEVSSGARCPKHNSAVSGTGTTGPHTTGRAIDLKVTGLQALTVIKVAMEEGFTGIGVNQKGAGRFIHIDDLPNKDGQPRPHIWSY